MCEHTLVLVKLDDALVNIIDQSDTFTLNKASIRKKKEKRTFSVIIITTNGVFSAYCE